MDHYFRVQAQVHLDAIVHNIEEVKRVIGSNVGVMPVIKADAYGHGAVPVAKALSSLGVKAFAVAILEEGIELREHGITEPIVILGYTDSSQYQQLMTYDIEPTIYSYEMAKELSEVAVKENKQVKLHVKLDTGMSRIGFDASKKESLEDVKKIAKLPQLTIQGLFTHFACADETNKDSAKEQKAKYDQFVSWLSDVGIDIPVKHVANSATIIDLEDWTLDMVRSGIITYGLYPSEEVDHDVLDLWPALELKSHIVHLKELDQGVGISYNHTFVTTRKTKVATIPVGYADGYPRSLSNKGQVLIRGQYAPIIGRICMDQFMVDVTDIPGVDLFDEVTLVGQDGTHRLSVEEVANLSGSFNYEFVCDISKRVPRVYL